ncbi:MAG: site-specific DNA-methyltransferase [Arcobacteraceae bacterium]|jgi:adenine-specific DNA-methyltransferase|nr:site-specific DNA-methyltransferase [Arcobacteraceae bacterium]
MNNIKFDKLKMQTPNICDENIKKLKELFPQIISEDKIDFDILRQLLSENIVEADDERYRLDWVGKKRSLLKANAPINKTLRPCIDESVDFENTNNLYIEGDNFEVLKLLQESYLNKIKMIYIDPPYNTGKDFVYRDNFTQNKADFEDEIGLRDEEGNKLFKNTDSNGRFHSDWLSMMYERLIVARDLLKDDGVIFISIDDNEVHNLRKICDEVFGEGNFKNSIMTRRRVKSLNIQFAEDGLNSMNVGFEYVLVYAKTELFTFKALRMKKNIISQKGSWNVFWSNADRPTMRYELLGFTPETGQWRWSKEKSDEAIKNYKYYLDNFSKNMTLEEYWKLNGETLKFIRRIDDGYGKNGGVQYWVGPSDTSLRTTNWTDIEVSQIKKDFDISFDNPKNIDLIKTIISTIDIKDFISLDFFSGSSTTAHAVMKLNSEDGGNRKFIMVQIPELTDEKSEAFKAGYKNICEIGKERIRRAGSKILEDNKDKDLSSLDIGFRVLKTDSTNFKDVYYHPNNLNQNQLKMFETNIKEDRSDLDLLFSIMLDLGIELSLKINTKIVSNKKLYLVENSELIVCFEENINLEIIQAIKEEKPLKVVLKDGCFANDTEKINAILELSLITSISVI